MVLHLRVRIRQLSYGFRFRRHDGNWLEFVKWQRWESWCGLAKRKSVHHSICLVQAVNTCCLVHFVHSMYKYTRSTGKLDQLFYAIKLRM